MSRLRSFYQNIFSLDEIQNEKTLKIIFGTLLLGFYISFFLFSYEGYGSLNQGSCWPFFQKCESIKFLIALPKGYSMMAFYSLLYAVMIFAAVSAYNGRWLRAHASMLVLFTWKVFLFLFLSYDIPANFEYFHIALCAIFLFSKLKLYFFQRTLVSLYFLSALVKFHDAWITGSYFTSLELGMPFVPNEFVPIFSNFVIFLEVVLCWGLLSSSKFKNNIVFILLIFFHLYSITMVGFNYPTFTLLPLLVAFGIEGVRTFSGEKKQLLSGCCILFAVYIIHFLPLIKDTDRKYTLEGYKLGLAMFDSNHQCRSNEELFFIDGHIEKFKKEIREGMNRCAPYYRWYEIKKMCTREGLQRISWTFDHSINGGPFYRIVDTQNLCNLQFNAWSKNNWLNSPNDLTKPIGYPVKNHSHGKDPKNETPLVFDDPQIQLTDLQKLLRAHLNGLILLWWSVWCSMGLIQITFFLRNIFKASKK